MAKGKFYRFKSRLAQVAANNLGIIDETSSQPPILRGDAGKQGWGTGFHGRNPKYRSEALNAYDKYYEGSQYNHLEPWGAGCNDGDYVAIRKRKPRIIYAFAKVLTSRIASKLVGESTFPSLKIEDDPDTTEYLRAIIKASKIKSRLIEPIRRMANDGSVFVRFYVVGATIKIEHFLSNYCYPAFDEAGELTQVEVKYVYCDPNDRDPKTGKMREKWFRMLFTRMEEIEYDNPEYKDGVEPTFVEVDRVDHGLGFVQGEWLRTDEERHSPDGYSLISDILDFIDEINYSLSQSSQSVGYNQDPQTILNGISEEDVETLIRSSSKAWNLGKDGKAAFLEAGLEAVTVAGELRDSVRLGIQDIARVVMLDPEKVVAHATSGKAMEIMHGPMVELINELRPVVEDRIIALVLKMAVTNLMLAQQGYDTMPVAIPEGYAPKSMDIVAVWPEIFPMTLEDLQKKVAIANQATAGLFISRETATAWVAKDFGVEDVEEEQRKIAAQPVINPFGSF